MKGLHIEDILRRMMHVSQSRNQADLAATLGVQRAAVTDAKRRGAVPPDWYMRLCRMYGANPVWLETGLGADRLADPEPGPGEGFVRVPLAEDPPRLGPDGLLCVRGEPDGPGGLQDLDSDMALGPDLGPGQDEASAAGGVPRAERHAFSREFLARAARGSLDDLTLLPMAGNAMEPTLRDGDLLLIDQSQRAAVCGKVFALAIDGRVLVRRLDARPGSLLVVADNRDYPLIKIPPAQMHTLRIVGRAVWLGRESL